MNESHPLAFICRLSRFLLRCRGANRRPGGRSGSDAGPRAAGAAPAATPTASAQPLPRVTGTEPVKRRAPTLYAIIIIKLLKGALFVGLAITAYTLSDNDLPAEYQNLLHVLRLNPESRIWAHLANQVSQLTETKVLVASAGMLAFSLLSLIEGIGLLFRVPWAGWMAIGESIFFIPIEIDHLLHRPSVIAAAVLGLNILIVWYLVQNRRRLFRHHR